MEQEFLFFFLSWSQDKKIYLVGGSDKKKIERQIPSSVIQRCAGVFCSSGNELWIKDQLVYRNDWTPTRDFLSYLSQLYQSSLFTPKGVKFIEKRTGMVNFSIVGREASYKLRETYHQWDKENKDREEMARSIMLDHPNLQACIGGQISIDIYPKGQDKSQASRWVRENIDKNIFFAGDKCFDGGNDHSIYLDVKKHGGVSVQVEGPNHTAKILANY